MVPVVLFQVDDEFGVMVSGLDGGERHRARIRPRSPA
jgi:hypothetical protein